MSIPFYSSQRVQFKRDSIKAGDSLSVDEGVKIDCRVVKNRFSNGKNPYTTCIYYARYGKGIDSNLEILNILIKEGKIRKAGAWLRFENTDGEIIDVPSINGMIPGKWNGSSKFNEFLTTDNIALEYFKGILSGQAIDLSEEEIDKLKKEEEKITK